MDKPATIRAKIQFAGVPVAPKLIPKNSLALAFLINGWREMA